MSNRSKTVHLGLLFPKQTVNKIDELRGKYISRNKYMLKVIEEYLYNERDEKLQGSSVVGRPKSQAAVPTTTTDDSGGGGTSD